MKIHSHSKRAALALFLTLLLALCLPLAVSAAEGEGGEEAPVTTAAPERAPQEDVLPVGTVFYEFFTENLSGLLSGATFLLALVLSLLLRRRVLPPLLETLTSLLGKSRELGEALSARESEGSEKVAALFDEAERILGEARSAAERAEEAAAAIRQGETGREEAALILREQTALLYELLMSANLPQYQKDRIGEAHAAVRAALREICHD